MTTLIARMPKSELAAATSLIAALGNPASPALQGKLDAGGMVHFLSLHAIPSEDGVTCYLVLEFTADGDDATSVAWIATALAAELQPIFEKAEDWTAPLPAYLLSHRVMVGPGWFDSPGLAFAGTPGLTVGEIKQDAALAERAFAILGEQQGGLCARKRLDLVRDAVRADPALADMLSTSKTNAGEAASTGTALLRLIGSAIWTFFWPVPLLALVWGVLHAAEIARTGSALAVVVGFFGAVICAGLVLLGVVVLALVLVYLALRRAEATDPCDERFPDPARLTQMTAHENRGAQNHMISVTRRKPGLVRAFTLRLIFFAIAALAPLRFAPGFLGKIGTIHFARWVTPPGSRDLLFFSNYGGSWESYLEDFITLASNGLTGVWSNTIGFPRTENLIQKGATDGERFKRFARHSMYPTPFWYSAYPDLTTAQIRRNAAARSLLASAATEDDAIKFLALFGSKERPLDKLISSNIQSLVFGGLGFLKHGGCRLMRLPADRTKARTWLRLVLDEVAFNDGRRIRGDAVVQIGLTATGLTKLGLPDGALQTFPVAFADGMNSVTRSRILGDQGKSDPANWDWGSGLDAVLLLYGKSQQACVALQARLAALDAQTGASSPRSISFQEITDDKTEPFGFRDGISQPILRGTYKALRYADPIHLVEPGEFILGYPNNRGQIPPGPFLDAQDDPHASLPVLPDAQAARDLGQDGTFLVIRQLQQDVEEFWRYCEDEATRLRDRLDLPYDVTKDFIGAKLVGRWRDGSALVRHPYYAKTAPEEKAGDMVRAAAKPAETAPIQGTTTKPEKDENDFLFGAEDPEALRCPFGAHIRRANPRDSLDPGSADQIAISNRHRILRIGRLYRPEEQQKPGLMFMCLAGDIERQFEFLQQTWLRNPAFHGLTCEDDALVGDGRTGSCNFTIPTRDGPIRLSPLQQFVTTLGGGYFFLPGRRLLQFLSV